MKKNITTIVLAFVTTLAIAFSFTNAQSSIGQNKDLDFFGDVSIKVFCTFSSLVGGDIKKEVCNADVLVTDTSTSTPSGVNATTGSLTTARTSQINNFISGAINSSRPTPTNVVYVQGPKGADGKNGTTTIVYQTVVGGLPAAPAVYLNQSNGYQSNPNFQTTVPGDIWETLIHVFHFDNANGNNLASVNILASNTNTTNLIFGNATGTNLLVLNGSITNATTTNLFSNYASITEATSTNLYSLFANLINLLATDATITNATSTNFFATNASLTNATATNIFANFASITEATSTMLFSTKASITEATTTYFFAVWANFMNLFVENLSFVNATGTNLQVANASTTNFSATGTSVITNLFGTLATFTEATTTNLFANAAVLNNAEVKAGNATLTALVAQNSTSTNTFATNASLTNATTTNLFAALFRALNASIDQLAFTNATGTTLQLGNLFATNINATGTATITNAVITNATATNIFATNASLTNATVTRLFANAASVTNATTTNIFSNRASITNGTSTTWFSLFENITNLFATRATITNATVTNISANTITGDGVNGLTLGTLTNDPINFMANGAVIMSLNPGDPNAYELRLPGPSDAYFGDDLSALNIFASTTDASTTNAVNANFTTLRSTGSTTLASTTAQGRFIAGSIISTSTLSVLGTSTFATTTSASSSVNWLNVLSGMFVNNATITNATATKIFATNASITNATTTNLFAALFRTLNATIDNLSAFAINTGTLNATSSVNTLVLNASTTNASTTNTLNLLATRATFTNATSTNFAVTNLTATGTINLGTTTMFGSLIPNASTTYHTLGTLANPWAELYVSSSSVYIGNAKLSNNNGVLSWGGSGINFASSTPNSTSTFGVVSASSTLTTNLSSTNATITNSTSTNLFASLFNSVNAKIDNLVATNATLTNATSTNIYVANMLGALSAVFTNLTASTANVGTLNASTTNASTTNTLNLFALNASSSFATITNATVTNLNVKTFSPATLAEIATNTLNSLNFSTSTNLLTSIVNGKISTTSLAALMGTSSVGTTTNIISLRQINFVSTTSVNVTADNDFQFNIAAGEKWIVQSNVIGTTSAANANLSLTITNTGSGTCDFGVMTNSVNNTGTGCGTLVNTGLDLTGGNALLTGVVTATANGVVKLGFARNTNAGTVTINPGSTFVAYKVTGADLAEVYFAKDINVEEGDVVALDGTGISQVTKTSKKYQKNVLGIISTKPGLVIGEADGTGKAVIVGLSGRVPVKVSTKNGDIKAGDFLTTSDISGVAMKSTGAGQVIGQALTNYENSDVNTVGKVYVFIKNTYHDGTTDEDTEESIADKFTLLVKNAIEKLSDVYLNMTLAISNLKAENVSASKVSVREFCVGGECFTEADMKEFRNYLNSKKVVENQVPVVIPTTSVVPNFPIENDPTVEEGVASTSSVIDSVTPQEVSQSEVIAPVVPENTEVTSN